MGKFRFALLSVGLCMVAGKPSGESQRNLSGGPVLDNRWEGFGSSVPDVVDPSRVEETGDRSFVAQNTQGVTGIQQPPLASGNMEDVTGVEVKSSFFDDIQGLQSVNLQERVRPVVTERTRSWQEPSGDNLGASGHREEVSGESLQVKPSGDNLGASGRREEALGNNLGAPVDQEEASGDNTGVAGSGQEASDNNLGSPVDQEEASGDNTDVDDDWKEPESHLQDREGSVLEQDRSLQDSSDDLHMSTTTDDLVIVDVSPRPVDSSLSLEDVTFPGLHPSEWVNLETSSENMKTPVQDMKTPPGKKPWKPSFEKTKPPAQDMKPLDKDMKTPPGKKPWKPSSEKTKPPAQDMKPHVDTKDMKTPPGKKPWKPSSADKDMKSLDKDMKPLDKDMKTPPGKKPWKTSKSGEETQHLLEPSSTESDVEKTRFQEQGWFQRLLGSNLPKHVAKKPKTPSLLPVAEEKKLLTGKPLLVNNDYVLVSQKKPHGNLGPKPSAGKPVPDMEKGLTQMLLKAW